MTIQRNHLIDQLQLALDQVKTEDETVVFTLGNIVFRFNQIQSNYSETDSTIDFLDNQITIDEMLLSSND